MIVDIFYQMHSLLDLGDAWFNLLGGDDSWFAFSLAFFGWLSVIRVRIWQAFVFLSSFESFWDKCEIRSFKNAFFLKIIMRFSSTCLSWIILSAFVVLFLEFCFMIVRFDVIYGIQFLLCCITQTFSKAFRILLIYQCQWTFYAESHFMMKI